MRKFFYSAAVISACMMASCKSDGPTQEQYDALRHSFDSLTQVQQTYDDLVNDVNVAIDSIAIQESMLFITNDDAPKPNKAEMLQRLSDYKQLLSRQREQLEELKKKNASNGRSIEKLNKMIAELSSQLAEKEQRISELEEELASSKRDIASLRTTLTSTKQTLEETTDEKNFLQEVATNQDKLINTGYFIVGTKSELKDLGLMEGVFKKKANYANIDKTKFTEVDIREFSEITFESKKVKLITDKPADSYTLSENGDGTCTLRITDATRFWEASQFLIIQSK